MSENKYMTPDLELEVKQWVKQLLASAGRNRQQAASELSRLGVWTRGGVRTRGSLRMTAGNRLPEPEKLQDVVRCLGDADKGVRCQVALALAEWGGEAAAAALCEMLQSDTDEEAKLYYITALRIIGGPVAAEGLRLAVEQGTEAVREAAIAAIEELATGGAVEYTEGPAVPQRPIPSVSPMRGAVRTRGGIKTQGGGRRARGEDVVSSIADTLQRIRADDTAPEFLRQRADEVLAYLME